MEVIPWNGTSGDLSLLFLNKKTFILLNYLQKNQNYRSAISICKGKTLSANFYFKNTLKQCCHTATLTISRFFYINQIIYFSFYPCLRKVCTKKNSLKRCNHTATLAISRFLFCSISQIFSPCLRKVCTKKNSLKRCNHNATLAISRFIFCS